MTTKNERRVSPISRSALLPFVLPIRVVSKFIQIESLYKFRLYAETIARLLFSVNVYEYSIKISIGLKNIIFALFRKFNMINPIRVQHFAPLALLLSKLLKLFSYYNTLSVQRFPSFIIILVL